MGHNKAKLEKSQQVAALEAQVAALEAMNKSQSARLERLEEFYNTNKTTLQSIWDVLMGLISQQEERKSYLPGLVRMVDGGDPPPSTSIHHATVFTGDKISGRTQNARGKQPMSFSAPAPPGRHG